MAVAKGLTEKVRSGKRFAGGEGQLVKNVPDKGNSQRKGPEAGVT